LKSKKSYLDGKKKRDRLNNKVIFLFMLLTIFSISLVSSESFGYGTTEELLINYTIIVENSSVNASEIWITDEGNKDNVADITYDEISGGDVNALGYTGTFNFIDGVVGRLSMDGDPWYLGGADLELGQELTVDGYSNLNDTFPLTSLTHDLGSGALRWRVLYVQNISAENIEAFNLVLSENLTISGFINGVNISNLSGSFVPYTGATAEVDLGSHNVDTSGVISGGAFSDGTLLISEGDISDADTISALTFLGKDAGGDIVHRLNSDGSAIFNNQGQAASITFKGDEVTNLLVVDGANEQVLIGDKLEMDIVNDKFVSSFATNQFTEGYFTGNVGIGVAVDADDSLKVNANGNDDAVYAYNVYSGTNQEARGGFFQVYSNQNPSQANPRGFGGEFEAIAYQLSHTGNMDIMGGRFNSRDNSGRTYGQSTGTYDFFGGYFSVDNALGDWTTNDPTVKSYGIYIAGEPTGYGDNHEHYSIYSAGGESYFKHNISIGTDYEGIFLGAGGDSHIFWNNSNSSVGITSDLTVYGNLQYTGALTSFSPQIFCSADDDDCLSIDFKTKEMVWCSKSEETCEGEHPEIVEKLRKVNEENELRESYQTYQKSAPKDYISYSYSEWKGGEEGYKYDHEKQRAICEVDNYHTYSESKKECIYDEQKEKEDKCYDYAKENPEKVVGFDGTCKELKTEIVTYTEAVEEVQADITIETTSTCYRLNAITLREESYDCVVKVPNGAKKTIKQFKENCFWEDREYKCLNWKEIGRNLLGGEE